MSTSLPLCRVAVGILLNPQQQILIAERPAHASYAGFWEFPGGKLETGETIEAALRRELFEEVGVEVLHSEHLITVSYTQPKMEVELYVHKILSFAGEPSGCEGQRIRWVELDQLSAYTFPPANSAIVQKLLEQMS